MSSSIRFTVKKYAWDRKTVEEGFDESGCLLLRPDIGPLEIRNEKVIAEHALNDGLDRIVDSEKRYVKSNMIGWSAFRVIFYTFGEIQLKFVGVFGKISSRIGSRHHIGSMCTRSFRGVAGENVNPNSFHVVTGMGRGSIPDKVDFFWIIGVWVLRACAGAMRT